MRIELPAPSGWVENALDAGRCLVMLDGLDEVGDMSRRKMVADWVERQIRRYGSNRFLVTARPFEYRTNPLSDVTVLEVRQFNQEQVHTFVRNWYVVNKVMSAQKDDAGIRIAAQQGAEELLARLKAKPSLLELAENPLIDVWRNELNKHLSQIDAY